MNEDDEDGFEERLNKVLDSLNEMRQTLGSVGDAFQAAARAFMAYHWLIEFETGEAIKGRVPPMEDLPLVS